VRPRHRLLIDVPSCPKYFADVQPELCGVEAVRPDLVKYYFAANGYELIEKYLKVDKINLYFRPKPAEETQDR